MVNLGQEQQVTNGRAVDGANHVATTQACIGSRGPGGCTQNENTRLDAKALRKLAVEHRKLCARDDGDAAA